MVESAIQPRDGSSTSELQPLTPSPVAPYSVFTSRQKKFIVALAAAAGLFSPITGSIYYPVLTVLARDYHVSNSLINLTVTTYLIFQGLAPSFIGSLSDVYGRKPAYYLCFIIYIGANIGLALQNDYTALLILRCLQSAGSSGTIALAGAVVTDIVTSAERGAYIGYVSLGVTLGPGIGPVIGGLLAQYQGWRAIFWFLTISAGVQLILLIVFMPETCRLVVGNGSIPAKGWNKSISKSLEGRREDYGAAQPARAQPSQRLSRVLFQSFIILFSPTTGPLLLVGGIFFAFFYLVLTVLPSQLETHYQYNTIEVSLCYLPIGFACLVSAVICGRFLLDRNFQRYAKRLGIEISKDKQQDLSNFPIERARLEVCIPIVWLSAIFTIGFAWTLRSPDVSIAGVEILLFLSCLTIPGVSQVVQTITVDLNRDSAGAASAALNLTRAFIGAAVVAAVDPVVKAFDGVGWVGVLAGGIFLLLSIFLCLIWWKGMEWRQARDKKLNDKKARLQAPLTLMGSDTAHNWSRRGKT